MKEWIKSELLSRNKALVHGFSTRVFSSNLKETARAFNLDAIFTLKQVHSSHVITLHKRNPKDSRRVEGDALVTSLRRLGVGIFTADCVPILLAAQDGSLSAAVHAGWRGTLLGVSKAALSCMKHHFGVNPSGIYAALGPSIGGCCYEVGEEVTRLFREGFKNHTRFLVKKGDGKYLLDLQEINQRILLAEGVEEVEVIGICTKCNENFHSYRRDGARAGRQLSFIGLL